MCACEGSFVCAKCAGTPFDPNYEADAYEPMSEPDFDELASGPGTVEWSGWL